ncbi:membrane protein required for colicin V production [Bradyrhizobium sp. LM4.3]
MNSFDLAVYAALAIAIGFGFRTGLLGSAMTILAYLLAAPIAVALMPLIVPQVAGNPNSPLLQNWIWFFGIFVVVGMLFGYLGRLALSDTIREAGIGDRLGGAALGAIRVGLVATTLVLVFDQIVPANRQPPFLAGSHLRPLFSAAGTDGLQVAAAGGELRDRPSQAGAAHLIRRICIAAQDRMHFDASPSLISGAKVG